MYKNPDDVMFIDANRFAPGYWCFGEADEETEDEETEDEEQL